MSKEKTRAMEDIVGELYRCACSWEPQVRLLGNIQAMELRQLCLEHAALLEENKKMKGTICGERRFSEQLCNSLRDENEKFIEALRKVANWHYSTGAKDVAKYALQDAGKSTDTTEVDNE